MTSNRMFNILVPIIAVVFGLLSGAILMLVFGYNPIEGYMALWNGAFGDVYYFGETIRQITPYILTGLAVAFAFRSGDRKSTRLNSSHVAISYAVFCLT